MNTPNYTPVPSFLCCGIIYCKFVVAGLDNTHTHTHKYTALIYKMFPIFSIY